MNPEQIVEATLFASQAPLTASELARADESLTVPRVLDALRSLREVYDEDERSFQLYQLADGYQLLTRPEYAPYLERFDSVPRTPALSRAALETLAIIAYRQPIGRLEVEDIRGVGSATVLRTLQDWDLIEVTGRGEGLGRPLLYGTTRFFLDHFGLQELADLPKPEDLPIALRGSVGEEAEEAADDPDAGADEEVPVRGNGGPPEPAADEEIPTSDNGGPPADSDPDVAD